VDRSTKCSKIGKIRDHEPTVDRKAMENHSTLTSGKQTAQFMDRNGHYAGVCKSRRGDKKDEAQHDSKKTTAGTNHFTINKMKMSEKSGKISRVSQSTQKFMKQQNMKKLRHEVWDENEKMYIKSGLPEEPKLKIRM
jgi:hypothetical protein